MNEHASRVAVSGPQEFDVGCHVLHEVPISTISTRVKMSLQLEVSTPESTFAYAFKQVDDTFECVCLNVLALLGKWQGSGNSALREESNQTARKA
jgi:hypothetical protein